LRILTKFSSFTILVIDQMGMVRSKSFDKKENSGSDAGSNDSSGIYVVPRELKVKLEVSEAKETVYRADIL